MLPQYPPPPPTSSHTQLWPEYEETSSETRGGPEVIVEITLAHPRRPIPRRNDADLAAQRLKEILRGECDSKTPYALWVFLDNFVPFQGPVRTALSRSLLALPRAQRPLLCTPVTVPWPRAWVSFFYSPRMSTA